MQEEREKKRKREGEKRKRERKREREKERNREREKQRKNLRKNLSYDHKVAQSGRILWRFIVQLRDQLGLIMNSDQFALDTHILQTSKVGDCTSLHNLS